jgi:outer membrane protein
MDAVRSQVKSARAEHWPVLSLEASKTYSDQGYDNRLNPSYNVGTIGLRLTIPLYAGGRVTATEREANARFEIARETLEGARREVERDARTAYLTTESSYARIGSTNAEVQALEKTLQAQQKSHEMGVSTVVDVLNAQRLLLKSRSEQSRARYDYIRGLTTLRVHAGTLSQQDIVEMDGWMVRQGQARDQAPGSSQEREAVAAIGLAYAAYGQRAAADQARAQDRAAGTDGQSVQAPLWPKQWMEPAAAAQTTMLSTQREAWAPAQWPHAYATSPAAHKTVSALFEHAGLQGFAPETAGRCVAPFDRVYLR